MIGLKNRNIYGTMSASVSLQYHILANENVGKTAAFFCKNMVEYDYRWNLQKSEKTVTVTNYTRDMGKEKEVFMKVVWKNLDKDMTKNRIRLFLVIAFFLLSGMLYSRSFYGGSLAMGRQSDAETLTADGFDDMPVQININRAEERELTRLPGVGEKLAKSIVEYRRENGDFQEIADIMQVSGIGEKSFEEMKDMITVQ